MADAFPTAWRVLVVASASLCLLRLPAARAQAAAGEALCRPPDEVSGRMIEELRRLLSSADSAATAVRREARIIYQPTGTVAYVADEPVCDLAIRALNKRARTPSQRRQVYVYHLGSQYAVEDPEQRASEYRMVRIFNLDWELSGDVLLY
jgi:hypothetical protein